VTDSVTRAGRAARSARSPRRSSSASRRRQRRARLERAAELGREPRSFRLSAARSAALEAAGKAFFSCNG